MARMNDALRDAGLAGECGGMFWNPMIQLDLPDESLRRAAYTIYIQGMRAGA